MNDEKTQSGFGVAVEHAQRSTQPVEPPDSVNGVPVMLVPAGWNITPVPGWQPEKPHRIKAAVAFHAAESLCRYVNDFKVTETRIFAKVSDDGGRVVVIFDYHDAESGMPDWLQHRATFVPALATEWKQWTEVNRKAMSQESFALFLENLADTVQVPSGADLLQIINTIELDGKVEFRSAIKTQTGSIRLTYGNQVSTANGALEVPSEFHLLLPVFDGEEPQAISARLRYRLQEGKFTLWFELINPHLVIRAALNTLVKRIGSETGIVPLMADAPESAKPTAD